MHLVEHLDDLSLLLVEIARLLKPGGRVYFETPHPKTVTYSSPARQSSRHRYFELLRRHHSHQAGSRGRAGPTLPKGWIGGSSHGNLPQLAFRGSVALLFFSPGQPPKIYRLRSLSGLVGLSGRTASDMKPKLLVLELWRVGDLAISTPFLQAASQQFDVTLLAQPVAQSLQPRFFPSVKVIPFVAPWTVFHHKYRLWSWPWIGDSQCVPSTAGGEI
jgi:hypothetical protein